MERIASLYAEMDREYSRIAGSVGSFSCTGCTDNCCTQRFYHYTLAEYLYLMEGVKKAGRQTQELIFRRARVVAGSYEHEADAGKIFKLNCPVNQDGLCMLYEWRPMICRLHGLPHRFTMPDGNLREGGGCHKFPPGAAEPMDRTPFYTRLAEIEKELRTETGFRQRFKKTTAEMLVDMAFELEDGED
jgi:Fe-S-cluster containining protein